jgi:integrase/recombinase XerC
MEELVNAFAEHLQGERRVSAHTIRNYLSDLAQFCAFLVERKLCLDGAEAVDLRKVDIHVVRAFLARLTKDHKKSSMGRKLAALKSFFRYLVATKRLEKDPLLLILICSAALKSKSHWTCVTAQSWSFSTQPASG